MPDTAIARPAASVIVLRRDGAGLQLLMGWRGFGHRFMPNRLVFPGGAVDPADFTTRPARPLGAATLAALNAAHPGAAGAEADGTTAVSGLAAALGIAAARELEEETGFSLGHPPALDGLRYLTRLITPPSLPIRFDARFFLLDAARLSGTLAGSGELERLAWLTPEAALGEDLAIPTRHVVGLVANIAA